MHKFPAKNFLTLEWAILFIVIVLVHCATQKSSTNTSSIRQSIVQDAQEQIGTKYRSGGKTPAGFDCSGFVHYVMGKHHIAMNASADTQAKQGRKVSLSQIQPGDLLYFKRKGSQRIFHVGITEQIQGEDIWMIHASSSRGVIRENVSQSAYWKPKLDQMRSVIP